MKMSSSDERTPKVSRDVLERAVSEALEAKGYAGTPLADLAQEVLRIEIAGIDSRSSTQQEVVRLIERWADSNAKWMNEQVLEEEE